MLSYVKDINLITTYRARQLAGRIRALIRGEKVKAGD